MDYYSQLLTLHLQDVPSAELLALANEKSQDGDLMFYYFDSELYSRPHLLIVNAKGEIAELNLTIPSDKRAEYQMQLQGLGKPETTKLLGSTEQILAFPSKGISFVVNQSQQPIKLFFTQPTTKEVYIAQKLDPIPTSPVPITIVDDSDITADTIAPDVDVEATRIFSPTYSPIYSLLGIILLVSLLVGVLVFRRKRSTTVLQPTQPPQPILPQ